MNPIQARELAPPMKMRVYFRKWVGGLGEVYPPAVNLFA